MNEIIRKSLKAEWHSNYHVHLTENGKRRVLGAYHTPHGLVSIDMQNAVSYLAFIDGGIEHRKTIINGPFTNLQISRQASKFVSEVIRRRRPQTYSYFVAFQVFYTGSWMYGSYVLKFPHRLESASDINELRAVVRRQMDGKYSTCHMVITNIQLLTEGQ